MLADSGFTLTNTIIPMYRKPAGRSLPASSRFFNENVASARVLIEHTFGVLKQRWRALNGLNLRLRDSRDLGLAKGWIEAAVVLHNLCINTADRMLTRDEYDDIEAASEGTDHQDVLQPGVRASAAASARRERLGYDIHRLLCPDDVEERRAWWGQATWRPARRR